MTITISWANIKYRVLHWFRAEIIYSRDGKLFYTMPRGVRPRDWMALEKDAEGKYQCYPFAFYEIKSGRREWVSHSHELVKRYASLYR